MTRKEKLRAYYLDNKDKWVGYRAKKYASDPDFAKAYMRDYYKNNQAKFRARNLKRFGLTPEQYDEMFRAQGGLCAICGKPPSGRRRYLDVDHDHKNGRVRGLLCHLCNTFIGLAKDSVEVLVSAMDYLRRME